MKSSLKKIATAGLLSASLVIGSVGVVAYANGNAYENFKEAVFNSMDIQNATSKVDGTVRFDGETIASVNTISEMGDMEFYSKVETSVSGETNTYEISHDGEMFYAAENGKLTKMEGMNFAYREDGTIIGSGIDGELSFQIEENGAPGGRMFTVTAGEPLSEDELEDSDAYESRAVFTTVATPDQELTPSTKKLMEMVADILAGDIKTHFTGSGDKVQVNLEGAQIPEIMNVALNALAETNNKDMHYTDPDSLEGVLFDAMTGMDIAKELRFKSASYTGELTDGILSMNSARLVITGTDKSGNIHEIEIEFTGELSEIGTTVATDLSALYGEGV